MSSTYPRVLILGGSGTLGGMLYRQLSSLPGWRVRCTQRRDPTAPDFFNALETSLEALIAAEPKPDFIINAIGLTAIHLRELGRNSLDEAEAINARLPHRIAAAAAQIDARAIHFSTDGVFSGQSGPYDETAKPDATDLYGCTKAAGEVADPRVLTLRCSMVGPDPDGGRGLFEWFKRLEEGAKCSGFTDQRWNGVTTFQLADLCAELILSESFDSVTRISPVRHFCPNSAVTKYELLRLFDAALSSRVTIDPKESGTPLDRVLLSRWDDLNGLIGGPFEMKDAIFAMIQQRKSP